MQNERIGTRERTAWLFAALSVLSVLRLSGLGWLYVLLGGTAAAIFFCLLGLLKKDETATLTELAKRAFGKRAGSALLLLSAAWTLLVLASTLHGAATAFPEEAIGTLAVIVTAALTAIACAKGLRACAGAAGVLAMILVLLYGAIVLACLDQIEPEWCAVWGSVRHGARAFAFLLLPSCMLFLPPEKPEGKKRPGLVLLALLPTVPAFLCAACLSPRLTAMQTFPFYLLTKSLSLFSAMERFEPLLSGALLMGFACFSMLLARTAGEIFGTLLKWENKNGACIGATAVGLLLSWFVGRLPQQFWAYGSAIFWGVFPALTLLVVWTKKVSKKTKKEVDKQKFV